MDRDKIGGTRQQSRASSCPRKFQKHMFRRFCLGTSGPLQRELRTKVKEFVREHPGIEPLVKVLEPTQ